MTIIISQLEGLRAVAPFMSDEETRYYLKGVLFQKDLMIATDGHKLAAVKAVEFDGFAEPEFVLPAEIVVKVIRSKIRARMKGYFSIDTEAKTVEVFEGKPGGESYSLSLAMYKYEPINCTYPDWRRTIPQALNYDAPAMLSVNAKYLSSFQSFGTCIQVYPNNHPEGPSVIRARNEFFDAIGVLMPVRKDATIEVMPSWLGI